MLARLRDASPVPHISHPPSLSKLIGLQITSWVIQYIALVVREIVQSLPFPVTPLATPDTKAFHCPDTPPTLHPPLEDFIRKVIRRSDTKMPTVLCALVYLAKIKRRLGDKPVIGWPCSQLRVFIAALMIASKYANDNNVKNSQWAKITEFFHVKDLLSIELQFLQHLDHDCSIKQADILWHGAPLLCTPSPSVPSLCFRSLEGNPSMHVALVRCPVRSRHKPARLFSPEQPSMSALQGVDPYILSTKSAIHRPARRYHLHAPMPRRCKPAHRTASKQDPPLSQPTVYYPPDA